MHVVELPTAGPAPGRTIRFTLSWLDAAHWEGEDFSVAVTEP